MKDEPNDIPLHDPIHAKLAAASTIPLILGLVYFFSRWWGAPWTTFTTGVLLFLTFVLLLGYLGNRIQNSPPLSPLDSTYRTSALIMLVGSVSLAFSYAYFSDIRYYEDGTPLLWTAFYGLICFWFLRSNWRSFSGLALTAFTAYVCYAFVMAQTDTETSSIWSLLRTQGLLFVLVPYTIILVKSLTLYRRQSRLDATLTKAPTDD